MLKKILKTLASRSFYLLLGLSLAMGATFAWAAWNTTVISGGTLTATLWNDVVAKLVSLDNRVGTLEGGGLNSTGTVEFSIIYFPFSSNAPQGGCGTVTGTGICSVWGALPNPNCSDGKYLLTYIINTVPNSPTTNEMSFNYKGYCVTPPTN